ncbi:MAG: hypothetical protein K2N51_14865 [Lachnospiraceae bacterium]|nr:hypothetical protein [Lachnospiraceae bacterium]
MESEGRWMAKLWSDGQKLHTRLAYRVRLLNKWKPNNYPKVYGVSVADGWMERLRILTGKVCMVRFAE